MRQSEHKKSIKREPQGTPAAVGAAFDAFVKSYLVKELSLSGVPSLDEMLKDNVTAKGKKRPPNWYDQVVEAGQALFKAYLDCGAMDYALQDGLNRVELWITENIGEAYTHGRLDGATVHDIAFDWKIRGYASAPKSPTQGWTRSWKKGKLMDTSHKKVNTFFEKINPKWAQQLCIYNILLGHTVGDVMFVYFDEISMRNNRDNPVIDPMKLRINQIRSQISPGFQQKVYNDLQECWNDMIRGRYPRAEPKESKCRAFASLCEASEFCEPYANSYGADPEFEKLMKMRV